jgi:hypothetical protein
VARRRDIGRGAYFGYVSLLPSSFDDWSPRDDVGPGGRNLAVIAGPSATALLGVLSAVVDLHHQKCPAQKPGHETGCAPLQPQIDTAAEHYGQNYDDYDDEEDGMGAEAVHYAAPSRIRPFYTLGSSRPSSGTVGGGRVLFLLHPGRGIVDC